MPRSLKIQLNPELFKWLRQSSGWTIEDVTNNYDRDYITYTDALNYLSIKSKNFDRVLVQACASW